MGELQLRVGPSEKHLFISIFMTFKQYLITIFMKNMQNNNKNGIVQKKSKQSVMCEIFGDFQHWAPLWDHIVYMLGPNLKPAWFQNWAAQT